MAAYSDPTSLDLPYDVREIRQYMVAYAGALWPTRSLDGVELVPETQVFVISKHPDGYALHKGPYNHMALSPADKLAETQPGVFEVMEDVARGDYSLMRMTGSVTDTPLVNVRGVGIRRLVPGDVGDFGFYYRTDGTLLAEPKMLALPDGKAIDIAEAAAKLRKLHAGYLEGQRITAHLVGELAKVSVVLKDLHGFTAKDTMDCRTVPQTYRTTLSKIRQALEAHPLSGNTYLLIQAHHILRHLLDRTPDNWGLRAPALDVPKGHALEGVAML